jgi:4-aminobutyrate aminotransferase-like enzyme/Ser/Thr protein kinase RdoA (MazF antagonist)
MSYLEHTPTFNTAQAAQIAHTLYGITTTAEKLPSERDQNFLLILADGEKRVLKIANALEERQLLEAENAVMRHITKHVPVCPRLFQTPGGDLIGETVSGSGSRHFVRLISFLSGIPLGGVKRHSAELLYDLGRRVGEMDAALSNFDHPAAHRELHWDLANAPREIERHKTLITDPELRGMVESLAAGFEQNVTPLLAGLRQSVIQNDANDYNVIVGNNDTGDDDLYKRNQRVMGLIDFGDIVYSYTVANLAIAIAYAVLNKPDPLTAATHVVRGYHAHHPLTEAEISALFGLVCMRLGVSVCLAAHQQQQRPDDAYLSISQNPIRATLPLLAKIHPRLAEATFRHACGLPPVPDSLAVQDWLQTQRDMFAPLLGVNLQTEPVLFFDLGPASPLIQGDPDPISEPEMTQRMFTQMQAAGTAVGIGRYNEPRLIYTAPMFATGDTLATERRTVHIGIDLFAAADSAVYAPLAGRVHACAINDSEQDYGGVIILKHSPPAGPLFYTLYGHLSHTSVTTLQVGQPVAKGEQFAELGKPAENGGWTPHLHFQIITDLLALNCDFPGVVPVSQRNVWTAFSPDPNLIAGVPESQFPPPEPDKTKTLAVRRQRTGRNLSVGYRDPLKIVRGWRQYLYDETGRKYLDAYNNVPHVGHCHPRVIEAAQQQMTILNTNTRYLHDNLNRYAERLVATLPDPLNVCFFLNSASEANELAIRLARTYTGRQDMIVLEGAYHGHTNALIDISPYKHDGPGGRGAPPWVHTAPIPDGYRGPYKYGDPQAGQKYARHVADIISRLQTHDSGPAAYIAESCPSVGGQIFFPDGYLAAVYQYVRQAGGLCVADEVQTGYGRTGTHFYAFEAQQVVPDIVVLGKPIGNGHPIAALVTTPEIAEIFDNGMEFFSTFGGNTVSCAVGLTVLTVVQEEKLQAHALEVGSYLLDRLHPLRDKYAIMGDVRGSGLFLGVEMVRNRQTLEPAAAEASFIANRMREHAILLGTDGPLHNVIKIRPPMPFTRDNADFLATTLDKILAEDFGL